MSATALPSTGAPPRGWAPCSDRSAERGDPLEGTGGFGERWLLVEIDGSWGRHAFFQSHLDPDIGRAFTRRAEGAGIRPVAIRRFGRRGSQRRPHGPWRWALADSRPGRESVRWGEVATAEELLTIPLDGTAGTPSDEPLYLVCTHARHDQCCAVKGRPVAGALDAAHPDRTWESSHLGGDRFAATMILLPHGLYYGRVAPADAADIVALYDAGRIRADEFRGRSAFTNVAQAAQAFARAAIGDDRIDTLLPLGEERLGDTWTVRLAREGEPVTVALRETRSEPLLSTCDATRPASVSEFGLISVG